jgi:hypothetical protein
MSTIEKEVKPQITVKDFKNWLEGVIEMQDDDWVPDARQWNRILGKIYDISDSTLVVPAQNIYTPRPQVNEQHFISPVSPTAFDYAQPSQSGLSAPVIANNPTGPFARDQCEIPVKTPDIDTTNGYKSTFA